MKKQKLFAGDRKPTFFHSEVSVQSADCLVHLNATDNQQMFPSFVVFFCLRIFCVSFCSTNTKTVLQQKGTECHIWQKNATPCLAKKCNRKADNVADTLGVFCTGERIQKTRYLFVPCFKVSFFVQKGNQTLIDVVDFYCPSCACKIYSLSCTVYPSEQ